MSERQHLQVGNPEFTKAKLEAELRDFAFTDAMAERVILSSKCKTSFWEREIVIPVPTAALILLLLVGTAVFPSFLNPHQDSRRMVVTDTGVFDEKLLVRGTGQ